MLPSERALIVSSLCRELREKKSAISGVQNNGCTPGGAGGGVLIEETQRGGLTSACDTALRDEAVSVARLDLPFIRGQRTAGAVPRLARAAALYAPSQRVMVGKRINPEEEVGRRAAGGRGCRLAVTA